MRKNVQPRRSSLKGTWVPEVAACVPDVFRGPERACLGNRDVGNALRSWKRHRKKAQENEGIAGKVLDDGVGRSREGGGPI